MCVRIRIQCLSPFIPHKVILTKRCAYRSMDLVLLLHLERKSYRTEKAVHQCMHDIRVEIFYPRSPPLISSLH